MWRDGRHLTACVNERGRLVGREALAVAVREPDRDISGLTGNDLDFDAVCGEAVAIRIAGREVPRTCGQGYGEEAVAIGCDLQAAAVVVIGLNGRVGFDLLGAISPRVVTNDRALEKPVRVGAGCIGRWRLRGTATAK